MEVKTNTVRCPMKEDKGSRERARDAAAAAPNPVARGCGSPVRYFNCGVAARVYLELDRLDILALLLGQHSKIGHSAACTR